MDRPRGRSLAVRLTLMSLLTVLTPVWPAPGPGVAAADEAPTLAEHAIVRLLGATPRGHTASSVRAELRAYGRDWMLDLIPSPVVVRGARTVRVTEEGRIETPTVSHVYRGQVVGEPGSMVAVAIEDQALDGVVRLGDELYVLEPASRVDADAVAGDTIVYRGSQAASAGLVPTCVVDDALVSAPSASGLDDASPRVTPPQVLELAIVADNPFFQVHGANAETRMQSIVNVADAFYVNQIGVTFRVIYTEVFESADPFASVGPTCSGSDLLSRFRTLTTSFGSYRNGASGPLKTAGLGHLFTDRFTAPCCAGFGFIDKLCSASQGVAVSTADACGTSLHGLILAHEIGHNFGADHDGDPSGSCPNEPTTGYIMAAAASGNSFSPCSEAVLKAGRDAASCILDGTTTTTTTSTTTLPPPECGDANGDGEIKATDALIALKTGVGSQSCAACLCDVDMSGDVKATDALVILKSSVGQAVNLQCVAC